MDATMFRRMRVRPGSRVRVLGAPGPYPESDDIQQVDQGEAEVVHLFIDSRDQCVARFPEAVAACAPGGVIWVSYPKSKGKKTYDINRDSLWAVLLDAGHHPVSQVALDDQWSAVRVKKNEEGSAPTPPPNVRL
ncbi:MAG: hypothetical protein FWF25_09905 [Propionibacteriaceae bacterium]|nr:hypothetical protein [Propionibacteriaceae bacterium]